MKRVTIMIGFADYVRIQNGVAQFEVEVEDEEAAEACLMGDIAVEAAQQALQVTHEVLGDVPARRSAIELDDEDDRGDE